MATKATLWSTHTTPPSPTYSTEVSVICIIAHSYPLFLRRLAEIGFSRKRSIQLRLFQLATTGASSLQADAPPRHRPLCTTFNSSGIVYCVAFRACSTHNGFPASKESIFLSPSPSVDGDSQGPVFDSSVKSRGRTSSAFTSIDLSTVTSRRCQIVRTGVRRCLPTQTMDSRIPVASTLEATCPSIGDYDCTAFDCAPDWPRGWKLVARTLSADLD